jgi:flagellar protein FlgJ
MKIPPLSPRPLAKTEEITSEIDKQKEKIKTVAKSFESLFVNHMIGEMRKTVNKSEFMPESQGERVYRSMLDTEYAKQISEADQLGLSKLVYDHLLRINHLE